MTASAGKCPTCGEKILASIGECLYCPPPAAPAVSSPAPARPAAPPPPVGRPAPPAPVAPPAPAAPAAPVAPPTPAVPAAPGAPPAPVAPPAAGVPVRSPADSAFGLLLFEAEEWLARGNAEKAVVHASRAVRERPESLTARSLWERARRLLVRGRRRQRLEARLREAQDLYEAGAFAASGKIVTTALKLIPDHPVALDLFGRLKDRRLHAATTEAEAERELDRLSRAEAQRALEAARTALIARWDSRALLSIRRGLRQCPDHPELLALHREVLAALEADHARHLDRRVRQAQVRAGLDLLARGEIEESLKRLRGLLREDPDYAPAQAAIQEVRRAWLSRRPVPAPVTPPAPAVSRPASAAASVVPQVAPAASPPHEAPLTGSWHGASSSPRPARPATGPRPIPAPASVIPPEILLPRTRRSTTPWPWIAFGVGSIVVGLFLLRGQGERAPAPSRPSPGPPTVPPAASASLDPVDAGGPLAIVPADLRQAIVSTLAAYGRALESRDADALSRARPDLAAAEREGLLARLQGAINVATDLRVLDAIVEGDTATVPVLRTDVIVGGRGTGPPVEETLHFERRDGVWALRAPR